MTLERIGLPGVGVSHLLTTRDGERLGIVARADGCRDLSFYDPSEPDQVAFSVVLIAVGSPAALARLHDLLAAPC